MMNKIFKFGTLLTSLIVIASNSPFFEVAFAQEEKDKTYTIEQFLQTTSFSCFILA